MATRALVTGGAGFIGSHLVRELLARGENVRVLDNFSTGKRGNLSEIAEHIELIDGDIRDVDTCAAACEGRDAVYHLAALGSVPRSIKDPVTTDVVNIHGTLQLLIAARDANVQRFVLSSSSSIYGDRSEKYKDELMQPRPMSPYAVSKLAGEEYCRVFHKAYGLEAVVLRYFNVFGPRQDPFGQYAAVIPRFVTALLEGNQPMIYGDGEQSRDFTYVSNVVRANILATTTPGVAGEVFNIACAEQISVNHVAELIARELECQLKCDYQPERVGDIKHSLADIAKAKKVLGFAPGIGFDEGLGNTVRYFADVHRGAVAKMPQPTSRELQAI